MQDRPNNADSPEQDVNSLREENARLRSSLEEKASRLREAEELIRAIRQGEVESLVVEQQGKEKIYILQSFDSVYRSVVEECFPYGVWLADATGKLLHASQSFLNVLKTDLGELQRKGRFHFLPPEVREIVEREWLQHEEAGTNCSVEYTIRAEDGSERSIWTLGTLNRSVNGQSYWIGANIDVTERNQYRDELRRQSEFLKERTAEAEQATERLRAITDNATTAIFMTDHHGRVTFLNPAAEELTGYRFAEIEGTILHDLIQLPQSVYGLLPGAEGILELNVIDPILIQDREEIILRKDGTQFHARCSARSVIKGGVRIGMVLEVLDITEQKRAEESLLRARDELEQRVRERTAELTAANHRLQREIEERQAMESRLRERAEELETLMDVLPVPVLVSLDPECRRITGNQAAFELLRVSRGANVSQTALSSERTPFRVFHGGEESPPNELPMQYAATTGKEVKGMIEEIVFADGARRTIEVGAAPLFDSQRRPRGSIGVMIDITERQRLEENLRESEERYRTVLEDQTEVVCRFRADGTFTFANDVFCRTFGVRREDLIGSKWHPVVHPDDFERVAAGLNSLSAANPIVRIDNRVVLADGKVRWMEFVNRGFFGPSGEMIENQAVGRDVTDRKEAEAQIAASLEEKQVLLKEIHHRVKNNLQVISSLLDMQSQYAKDESTIEMFRESQHRVRSMALVHERLYQSETFSSIDFGDYLQNLVAHMSESYSRVATGSVRFDLHFEPVRLSMDAAVPCGLLVNELVSNCLKHAFPVAQGVVTIRLSAIDEQAVLVVEDNGVGIPDHVLRDHPKTFGLRLVQALAKQLHGKLEIDGRGGTSVQITFPIHLKSGKR